MASITAASTMSCGVRAVRSARSTIAIEAAAESVVAWTNSPLNSV